MRWKWRGPRKRRGLEEDKERCLGAEEERNDKEFRSRKKDVTQMGPKIRAGEDDKAGMRQLDNRLGMEKKEHQP